ncbi:MAG: hypothetical protein ABJC98_22415 [Bacteroidota bacterium]
MVRSLANYSEKPEQVKKVKAGEVRVLLRPAAKEIKNLENVQYNIRVTLFSNQALKSAAIIQYMNFGIKNSFSAIWGKDTLPCAICERVPGIGKNIFLYIISFNKKNMKTGKSDDWRLYINDTIAGFGKTVFEING